MAVNVDLNLNPNTKKVEAALARIQAQARGVNFDGGARSIDKLSRPLGKITGQASEFQKSLEASNARVLAFGASVAVINKLSQAFGALVANTIKVEATFAKINTILGGTQKQLQQFGDGIFKVAQNTATSFDQVAEGALELARQGLSVEESLSRVETALKLVRVAGIDSQQAVAGLTAAIKGFEGAGLNVAQIADKLAEVDTKFAVSTEDLINGLERASASARVAGVSFDELLGVITTVQERTQRGGAVIGNAFKTIFARLGRTDTLQALEDLGINTLDASGNVRSAIPLFKELAVELDRLGLKSVEAGDIIQKVAGVRQRDILISLVEDLNSGQSQFAKSLQVSASAAGSLDRKNSALNETLEALINNLVIGSQKLSSILGELGFSDAAKDILKAFSAVVNGISDLLQGEGPGAKFAQGIIKGIGSVLTGPGLTLIAAVFIKLFVDLAKFGSTSLKSLLGINRASEQQNLLQKSVFQTLLQNEAIQKEILALEGNKLAQEQLLLKIYNQQAAALARVQRAAAAVTPGLFKGGFRGGESGVGKTGRGAGGYVAAEARDVSRGVGGAPASSKVVSIPNFAFGGGKRGTMVANTSEYFVPNYAGGGDAIFNRDMIRSSGLPSGARKINAADGYVPNFASPAVMSSAFNRMSSSQFVSKYGQAEFNLRQRAADTGITASERKRRADKLKKGRKGGKLISDPRFAMIVPQVIGPKQFVQGTRGGKKVGFNMVGFEPGVGNRVKNDEQLDDSVRKYALGLANSEAKKLGGPPKPEKVLKLANTGAISALSGTIFETAVSSLLDSKDFDARSEIAAFDFAGSGANQKLKKLFPQLGSATEIEAKIRLSKGNKESMFDKILKATGNAVKSKGKAASGYIPNFAMSPLDDAIEREKAAGLPISQIRINQSGKLRNAQNPDGLAVTNTRDEPTGRVPNFANTGGSPRPNASGQRFGGGGSSQETMSGQGGGGLFALFALQAAVGGLTNTVDDNNKTAKNFGDGLSSLINTLIVLNAVGLGPKGLGGFTSLGKFGDKLKKGFVGLQRFLGPVALGLGGLDAVLKAGGAGGIVETFKILQGGLTGKTFEDARKAPQKSALNETRTGFEGRAEDGIAFAQTQIKIAEATIRDGEKNKANEKGILGLLFGDETVFDAVINQRAGKVDIGAQESLIEGFQKEIGRLTPLAQEQFQKSVDLKTGKRITTAQADTRVQGFFADRAGSIETAVSKVNLEGEKKLLTETSLIEKDRIQSQIQSNDLIAEMALARNDNLQELAQELIESNKIKDVEAKKLETVLGSIDFKEDEVELVRKLATELGVERSIAKGILEDAKAKNVVLNSEEKTKKTLLKQTQELSALEAEIAESRRIASRNLNNDLNRAQGARQLGSIRRDAGIRGNNFELKSGPVGSARRREIGFINEELRLEGELAQLKGRAADSETTFLSLKDQADRNLIKRTDEKYVRAVNQLALDQERLEKLTPLIEAEKELAKARSQQSGFSLALEDLDTEILSFRDKLGSDIPKLFSDNLGTAMKDAISGAATLEEALLGAASNFAGTLADAFIDQAAKQATSSIMGSFEDGSGLFGSIGDFFKGNESAAEPIAGSAGSVLKPIVGEAAVSAVDGGAEKKGGISGFISGLFGGGKKRAAPGTTPTNPLFVQDVGSMKVGAQAESIKSAVKEGLGGEGEGKKGFFGGLTEKLGGFFDGFKDKIGGLFDGIKSAFTGGQGGGGGGIFGSILKGIGGQFTGGGGGLFSFVGNMFGFANGGKVGSTDTVPAMLTPGEFVVKKSAVDKYGTNFLSSLNNGVLPMQGFQNGGAITPVSSEVGNSVSSSSITNNSEFSFSIEGGSASQTNGESQGQDQRQFADRVRQAVTTVIQEESRMGGSLNYLRG